MSIKTVYIIECDRCGKTLGTGKDNRLAAEQMMTEAGWSWVKGEGDGHGQFCPEHKRQKSSFPASTAVAAPSS